MICKKIFAIIVPNIDNSKLLEINFSKKKNPRDLITIPIKKKRMNKIYENLYLNIKCH